MSRTIRIILAMVVTFIVSFVYASGAEKTFDKKFTATPGGTFFIKTDFGSVEITGTDAKEVSVYATLRGRQRDVDEFEITASQTSGGVEVRGKSPRSGRWFNWGSNDLEVRYTIKVPREYNLRMETSGGNITVNSVKGKLNGGTSGGDIALADISGSIDLETSGGNIRAEKVDGTLRMETSGGDIRISEVKGDVNVHTSGGNVTLNTIDGKVRAETSGGNITVRVKESNQGVFAETSGGNIDIMMPKNISATIDASTSGGDVTCDFPITMSGKMSDSRIRGTVNGGGNPIHARTSGGDIRILGMQ
ncbi:MAG: DUF4097 family beta strand repeat protein [Bacteroidetes bacterium]|nr:DUF4097 family beta strand repeat protein [Bacteroidota bacterium]MCW5894300.1 DUF4097 family beta strand repeat protein [Bacteroidota bacterium]